MKTLLALSLLITGCATPRYPAPEPCRICDASTAPRHDAPVRLFNPEQTTPCGRPHPGWSPALRERLTRERPWTVNPTISPMDALVPTPTTPMRVPVGIERELLLAKPKR